MPIKPMMLAFALIFATVAVPVQAGTENNPEVTDPVGDTFDYFLGMPDTSPGTEEVDIVAAWFQETGTTDYTITIQVQDYTDAGTFRNGMNIHQWSVDFTTQGQDFNAYVIRGEDGSARGSISLYDVTDSDPPSTEDGTASISFDDAANTISLTLPRDWTVQTDMGEFTFAFNDGTTLTNIIVYGWDGVGEEDDCYTCFLLDDTDPVDSSNFTFGAGGNGGGNGGGDEKDKCTPEKKNKQHKHCNDDDDGNNGHGNDADGCDESNPGKSRDCSAEGAEPAGGAAAASAQSEGYDNGLPKTGIPDADNMLDPRSSIGPVCVQYPPPGNPRVC